MPDRQPKRADSRQATAIYARYSSHNQDDGTSIDVQIDACQRAAGVPCVQYVDRAVSGTTMIRESFSRLLEDCERGLIKTVYVYKWDRFGRSARAHAVIADLEELNVQVISATEGYEPLSRGIQLVVAEDFSRKLSERIRAAKKLRFQQGGWHGGVPPFGYRVVGEHGKKRLEADWGGDAETVRWLFNEYVMDNFGYRQLARQLESRGVKPRRAKFWTGGTVRMMLSNPLYVGRPARVATANPIHRYRARACLSEEHLETRVDESLRIVSDETFRQVRDKQRTRKSLRPIGQNATRKFTKLMTCGCCGSTVVRTARGMCKDRDWYYTCGLRIRIRRNLCSNSSYLNEVDLVARVQLAVQDLLKDEAEIVALAAATAKHDVAHDRRRVVELEKSLAAIDVELKRLATKLLDDDLNDKAVKRLLSSQVAERTAARDQLQAEADRLAESTDESVERVERAVRQVFEEARQSFASIASDSEYNQFVRQLFGPIELMQDGSIRPKAGGDLPTSENLAEAVQYRLLDRKH
jgi:site-specific DNA recombinase